MLRFAMLHSAVTAGCLLWATVASAQYTQGNTGSQTYGAFGNRSIGSGINSGTSGFSSGQSSSQGSNNSLQSGGMNSGGLNSGAGSGAGNGNGTQNTNSQLRDMQAQRQTAGFIGADSSDPRATQSLQQQSQMQMQSLQSAFSQMNRMNQQRNQNQNRNQQQNKKQLRIYIKADIPLVTSASTSTALGRKFETRLKKMPGLEKRNSVLVSMEGRTAVLSGSVASDRDRQLVEGLALLEPGISAVRNELVVVEAASRAEELPVPSR